MGVAGAYPDALAVHHPFRLQKANQEARQACRNLLEGDVCYPLPGFVEAPGEPFGQPETDFGILLPPPSPKAAPVLRVTHRSQKLLHRKTIPSRNPGPRWPLDCIIVYITFHGS